MRINTNISSLYAINNLSNINLNLSNSLEKLSSGLKINKASDDSSGLAIADKLRTQASSLKQSIENGNSAVAFLQIADKAMDEQSNILDITKSKLIQASTATTSSAGRSAIAKDIEKLLSQLSNISNQTNYNGISILIQEDAKYAFTVMHSNSASNVNEALNGGTFVNGPHPILVSNPDGTYSFDEDEINIADAEFDGGISNYFSYTAGATTRRSGTNMIAQMISDGTLSSIPMSTTYDFQIGENSNNVISLSKSIDATISGLGLTDLQTQVLFSSTFSSSMAKDSMDDVDLALDKLNNWRSDIGSTQNQVNSAIRNMTTQYTNIKYAESIIKDVDYAQESSTFNKQKIIIEAGSFALIQSNNIQKNIIPRLIS